MRIHKRVYAAEEDEFIDDAELEEGDDDEVYVDDYDGIDDIADKIDDIADDVNEVKSDEVAISVENNIQDHFIAECERCGGIFISSVVTSGNNPESVRGVCPLCNEETEQFLKWVIKSVDEVDG